MKRTFLRKQSKSETATLKREIQKVLREIVIVRDKGCIFRHYPEAGLCGGYRQDGKLILQYDHLHSRVFSISYGDPRLGVCVCERHHIFWKRNQPDLYSKLARRFIGKERSDLLDRVQADTKPYHMNEYDWSKLLAGLKQEYKEIL